MAAAAAAAAPSASEVVDRLKRLDDTVRPTNTEYECLCSLAGVGPDKNNKQMLFIVDYRKASEPNPFCGWNERATAKPDPQGGGYPWRLPLARIDQPVRTVNLHLEPVPADRSVIDHQTEPLLGSTYYTSLRLSDPRLGGTLPGFSAEGGPNPRVFVRGARIVHCTARNAPDDFGVQLRVGKSPLVGIDGAGAEGVVMGSTWKVLPGEQSGYIPESDRRLFSIDSTQLSNPWFSRLALFNPDTIADMPKAFRYATTGAADGAAELMSIPAPPTDSEWNEEHAAMYRNLPHLWLATWIALSYFDIFNADTVGCMQHAVNAQLVSFLNLHSEGAPLGALMPLKTATASGNMMKHHLIVRAELFTDIYDAILRAVDINRVFSNVAQLGVGVQFLISETSARGRIAARTGDPKEKLRTSVSMQIEVDLQTWDEKGTVVVYNGNTTKVSVKPDRDLVADQERLRASIATHAPTDSKRASGPTSPYEGLTDPIPMWTHGELQDLLDDGSRPEMITRYKASERILEEVMGKYQAAKDKQEATGGFDPLALPAWKRVENQISNVSTLFRFLYGAVRLPSGGYVTVPGTSKDQRLAIAASLEAKMPSGAVSGVIKTKRDAEIMTDIVDRVSRREKVTKAEMALLDKYSIELKAEEARIARKAARLEESGRGPTAPLISPGGAETISVSGRQSTIPALPGYVRAGGFR